MRKFIFSTVIVIIIGIIAVCVLKSNQNESKQTTADSEMSDSSCLDVDNSDRLASLAPRHDSINHGLVDIAEELWRIDSAAANGNNIDREKWYSECEKVLIHGFDSIHQGSNLTNYQKADSMLAEIEVFFEKDADLSTVGMVINYDLQNSFLIYRMTALSKQVLNEIPSFDREIETWNDLEQSMYDFCLGVVGLEWYGGSGRRPAELYQMNSIIQCRIDDLKRIIRLCSEDDSYQFQIVKNRLQKSKARFKNAIERTMSSVRDIDWAKDCFECDEDRFEGYASLYIKVQESKKPLNDAFEKWLLVRSHVFKGSVIERYEARINNDNAITIDALSECVVDALTEG